MKIGVVSDTHSNEVPQQVFKAFKDVDFIIHAGDFCSLKDLESFKKIKEVKGVCGNMDDAGIRKIFPEKQVLKLGQWSIGLFHGEGPPKTIIEKVKARFVNEKIDCIIFGHSHVPHNEKIGGTLFFNPGSPNDKIFAPYCSYGILEVTDQINGKLIKLG